MLDVVDPGVYGGVIITAVFVGILLCLALGRRLGRRVIAREGSRLTNIGSLETAVFGLLGLLIAFTFSGALTRFDVRRVQAVDEANAISAAYLRIDVMPESTQPPLRKAFRDYVDARLATYRKLPDIDAARNELARSQELQADIWSQAVRAARMPNARPNLDILVLPALNQMFDITTVRVAATQMHPPTVVYAMLCTLALISALLAGYQSAAANGYDRVHKIGFAAIVAFTIFVVLDIEYPRTGWVRIDPIDQVLVNVRAGMK